MRLWIRETVILVFVSLAIGHFGVAGTIEGHVRSKSSSADLSNFVITVEGLEGAFEAPRKAAVMNQKALQFVPHVLAIQVGATVEFANSDPVSHNVFSISQTERFNLGLYSRGVERRIRFDRPGIVELLCNVHMEMAGFIVVVKSPYFVQTRPDGIYHINDVPEGRFQLRCWHEGFPTQERIVQVPKTGSTTVDFLIGK